MFYSTAKSQVTLKAKPFCMFNRNGFLRTQSQATVHNFQEAGLKNKNKVLQKKKLKKQKSVIYQVEPLWTFWLKQSTISIFRRQMKVVIFQNAFIFILIEARTYHKEKTIFFSLFSKALQQNFGENYVSWQFCTFHYVCRGSCCSKISKHLCYTELFDASWCILVKGNPGQCNLHCRSLIILEIGMF